MINILLCNFLIVGSLWLFCRGLMSRKYHHYLHEILLYVLLCVSSYCGFVWLRMCIVIIGCSWYVCSKYLENRRFQMLVLCVYFICLMMSEFVCANLYHIVDGISMNDYRMGIYTMLLCSVFLMLFVLLYGVYQMLRAYKQKYWVKQVWVVCILPIASIVLLLNVEDIFSLFVYERLVIVGLFGVLISNIIMFLLYRQVVQLYVMKEDYRILKDKYDSLHDLYVSSCVFLHDVTHKVFELKNGDDDVLRLGLNDLCLVLFQQFHNAHTNCVPLRNVLVEHQQELVECQIDVSSDMQVWHSSFNEELFASLLECGISFCRNVCSPRSMVFSSYEYHKAVVLKYAFSCDVNEIDDVCFSFLGLSSTKIVDGYCEMTFVFERGCV